MGVEPQGRFRNRVGFRGLGCRVGFRVRGVGCRDHGLEV